MSKFILHIDTASSRGLVMLSRNGECLAKKENLNPHDHAAFLQPAIKSLMNDWDVTPAQLTCIAVANGPGSYTGLRVGLAGAKGLCYAWKKPLLTVSSLHLLAKTMQLQTADFNTALPKIYVPMIDARRMEVFYALYAQHDEEIKLILAPAASVLDDNFITTIPPVGHIFFGGDGAPKWEKICTMSDVNFLTIDTTDIAFGLLATEQAEAANWADLAYCEPLYAKAFYSLPKAAYPKNI
jgi:tRNA threonylcarbamoyladenosine biosynthesis protein TsaB